MKLSLIFFSNAGPGRSGNPYAEVRELAGFGDENGFEAVWLPERHFGTLGGIYPNPAVVAAHLAAVTTRIRLRAGSVVVPLHHPASLVEDWSMVDNMSGGRVDLALASGWNVDDFVLAPDSYRALRDVWLERIDEIRALWGGRPIAYPNGAGRATTITVHPRPVQPDVPLWLTATKQPSTFEEAGTRGMNVLTMLAGIPLEQLAERIQLYRQARLRAGREPDGGTITLMLHTFVHDDAATVHRAVRGPFLDYIRTSLLSHLRGGAVDVGHPLSDQEFDAMAEYSFERYFRSAALFGGPSEARAFVEAARAVGVGEIACLLDYGPSIEDIRLTLPHLARLRQDVAAG